MRRIKNEKEAGVGLLKNFQSMTTNLSTEAPTRNKHTHLFLVRASLVNIILRTYDQKIGIKVQKIFSYLNGVS